MAVKSVAWMVGALGDSTAVLTDALSASTVVVLWAVMRAAWWEKKRVVRMAAMTDFRTAEMMDLETA